MPLIMVHKFDCCYKETKYGTHNHIIFLAALGSYAPAIFFAYGRYRVMMKYRALHFYNR